MTFTRHQLSPKESGDLTKLLASPGFGILMEMLRGELSEQTAAIGQRVAEMPEASFRSECELFTAIKPLAIRARELQVTISELEKIGSTEREQFSIIRITP